MNKIYQEAISVFQGWLDEAHTAEVPEPSAMVVASANPEGRISARTLLLKDMDERGFSFYTNLGSIKARQLDANPVAALCFLWKPLYKQVQVEGRIERVSDEEADAYFATRDRGSQVGAWASRQSHPLTSREHLEQQLAHFEQQFEGREVPRPEFWSGYRLVPSMIEFWHGQVHRLHIRWRYEEAGDGWTKTLLNP
jgi:pyridoxamine 5'-phosphate oxidase